MYYNEYGDSNNQTIVLLHCAGVLDMFEFMYDLSSDYHIVVPHILGTGEEVGTDYNLRDSVEGILEIITGLKKDKVYLVGHSLGAILAFCLVAEREELFEKVIISSPMLTATKKFIKLTTIYMTAMYPLLKSKMMGKAFVRLLKLSKEKSNIFLEYWSKVTLRTWQNYFTDGVNMNQYSDFGKVKTPILLIYGEKELKVIKNSIKAIEGLKTDCTVECVKQQGHGHPAESPVGFRKTVVDFFKYVALDEK